MGSLKDELRHKGLADDRRARQLAHEEKARRNKLGAESVEAERRKQEQERSDRERSRRESDRAREQERQKDEAARAGRHALIQLLRDHALTQGIRGPRRFHFVTRDRKIPFLDVSDDAARKLEAGALAICEEPDSDPQKFVVVAGETAERVRESAPEYVLFFNQGGQRG